MRWHGTIACDLPRGHPGVHTNYEEGLCWWGQLLFDPLPGSRAEKYPHLFAPSSGVKPIPPEWADETNSQLWAAHGYSDEPAAEPVRPLDRAELAAQSDKRYKRWARMAGISLLVLLVSAPLGEIDNPIGTVFVTVAVVAMLTFLVGSVLVFAELFFG